MPAYVHADSKNTKKERVRLFNNSRMITTKIQTLFSGELIVCFCMILAAAALMLTDSYYKAYKRNLNREMIRMIEHTKNIEWQRGTIERDYLKMTASGELMKKAQEMKLTVITSDKFVKFD